MTTELTGRELDAAIAADVFDMAPLRDEFDNLVYWVGEGVPTGNLDDDDYAVVPYYSTDANASRLVLAEMERRGRMPFIAALDIILFARDTPSDYPGDNEMTYLTAPPEAICRAALAACRGGKG